MIVCFFFSSRRRHTRWTGDWSSDVCSSDLLNVCKLESYRALAIGFSIYTAGLLAGVLWSYRIEVGFMELRIKQIGAVVAWVLFATLLQSYVSGVYRARRTILISAGAFIAIVVAMLGIHHV